VQRKRRRLEEEEGVEGLRRQSVKNGLRSVSKS
jgi:hypothetical protein